MAVLYIAITIAKGHLANAIQEGKLGFRSKKNAFPSFLQLFFLSLYISFSIQPRMSISLSLQLPLPIGFAARMQYEISLTSYLLTLRLPIISHPYPLRYCVVYFLRLSLAYYSLPFPNHFLAFSFPPSLSAFFPYLHCNIFL